ncbi:hypothetical protein ACWGEU_25985 [Streptomyces goshikiensis]
MSATGLMGDDAWGRQSGTGWDWLDQHAYHSESWERSEGLQNFLLRHGQQGGAEDRGTAR